MSDDYLYEGGRGNNASAPTHVLCIKERNSDHKGTVGVAWQRADGSYAIKLHAGIVLSWKDDIHISLFAKAR